MLSSKTPNLRVQLGVKFAISVWSKNEKNIWSVSQNKSFVCKSRQNLDKNRHSIRILSASSFQPDLNCRQDNKFFSWHFSLQVCFQTGSAKMCTNNFIKIIQDTANKEKNIMLTFSYFKMTCAPWEWNTMSPQRTAHCSSHRHAQTLHRGLRRW